MLLPHETADTRVSDVVPAVDGEDTHALLLTTSSKAAAEADDEATAGPARQGNYGGKAD